MAGDKLILADVTVENLQAIIETSDTLVYANSRETAQAHCQLRIDGETALLHPDAAITTSDIKLSFSLPDSVTFPDNTLFLLPIAQGPEVIEQGLADLSENFTLTSANLLTLLGRDPLTESFDYDPAEYTFTFELVLENGSVAVIETTLGTGVLTGDLHPTLPSIFDWVTGEVNLNFSDLIDPSVVVNVAVTHTDPATFVVTSETHTMYLSYTGQTVFTCPPVMELPLYPTSVQVTAASLPGTLYELRDIEGDGILVQTLPELPADSLDTRATGTVNYETGIITLEFPEVIAHKANINATYAKLQNVVRFTPVSTEPPLITITVPVEDWDRVAHAIETALDNAESAVKYRR